MLTKSINIKAAVSENAPGLAVITITSLAAMFLSKHYSTPVMLFALLLGMTLSFLAQDSNCKAGISLASSSVLKIGIALIGLRLTFQDLIEVGFELMILLILGIVLSIAIGLLFARIFKTSRSFGLISGGAVGICGASAALAISTSIPDYKERERDTSVVVVGVTLLSTIAMILYPIVSTQLSLNALQTGVFLGSTIHDVAQVVGAGYTISEQVGDTATVTKLARVSLLLPVVACIMVVITYRSKSKRENKELPSFPIFLVFFVILIFINSAVELPQKLLDISESVSRFALVMAIAAIGMKSGMKQLFEVGSKPFFILMAETVWLSAISLIGISILY